MKLYHLSRLSKRGAILRRGLMPQDKIIGYIQYEKRLFLFSNIDNIPFDYVAHSEVDLWEVDIPNSAKICQDKFGDSGHYYICKPVPKNKLKFIKAFD